MIATILPSSPTFHAVEYNERKVAKGVAELLEMSNFGHVGQIDGYTPDELRRYLMDWSSMNGRIRKPQFHLSISCRGKEYTHRQLLGIAHEYLRQMGYGQEGQPVLIYAHHDTENNHIHVITSRVDPQGRKIDHNHERVRSRETIERIVGEDAGLRADLYIKEALQYRFSSQTQFKAIMESSGYECYEENGEMRFKRGGKTVAGIPVDQIMARTRQADGKEKRSRLRVRALLRKFHGYVGDRAELVDLMKRKFGVDLVFFGSKDNPYGYMAVDHKAQAVYQGNTLMPVKELCRFPTAEERFAMTEQFIDALLEENPRLTAKEVNRHIWRQFGTHISKGDLVLYNKKKVMLNDHIAKALNLNRRIQKCKAFGAANEEEQAVICSVFKISDVSVMPPEPERSMEESATATAVRDALEAGGNILEELRRRQIVLFRTANGRYVFVDFRNKRVASLERLGIKKEELQKAFRKSRLPVIPTTPGIRPVVRLLQQQGGSSDSNREYEVGQSGYDEVDGEWKLRR